MWGDDLGEGSRLFDLRERWIQKQLNDLWRKETISWGKTKIQKKGAPGRKHRSAQKQLILKVDEGRESRPDLSETGGGDMSPNRK